MHSQHRTDSQLVYIEDMQANFRAARVKPTVKLECCLLVPLARRVFDFTAETNAIQLSFYIVKICPYPYILLFIYVMLAAISCVSK